MPLPKSRHRYRGVYNQQNANISRGGNRTQTRHFIHGPTRYQGTKGNQTIRFPTSPAFLTTLPKFSSQLLLLTESRTPSLRYHATNFSVPRLDTVIQPHLNLLRLCMYFSPPCKYLSSAVCRVSCAQQGTEAKKVLAVVCLGNRSIVGLRHTCC